MNIKAIELLAHTAWMLSDMNLVIAWNHAVEILSTVEDEISNAISILNGGRYRIEDFDGIKYISSSDLTDWKSRISDRCYYTEMRLEMLGEVKQSLATTIREKQDNKEMTRRAFLLLEQLGENADDLRAEFQAIYGEEV